MMWDTCFYSWGFNSLNKDFFNPRPIYAPGWYQRDDSAIYAYRDEKKFRVYAYVWHGLKVDEAKQRLMTYFSLP